MGRIVGWPARRGARAARWQAAALLGLAAITGAVLGYHHSTPAAPADPAHVEAVDERFGKSLIEAAFTPEGVRVRQAYPMEFGAVFGPSPARSYTELAAAEWSLPPAAEPAPARPKARPVLAALPPQRPAAEAPGLAAEKPAETPADDRARVFGVALPGFVPRGETVVRAVVGWGDRVAGLADMF